MADSISLHWLSTADASAIRADLDDVVDVLIRLRRDGPAGTDDATVRAAISQVLDACADVGPGALDGEEVRRILFPSLLYLLDSGLAAALSPVLSVIARRADVRSSKAINDLLRPWTTDTLTSDLKALDQDFAHGDDVDDELARWLDERQQRAVGERAGKDFALLQRAVDDRAPISVALAEAMYEDEAIWATDHARQWSDSLAQPLTWPVSGRASVAFINARLRTLRPRLFLRASDALVIEAIGERLDLPGLRQSVLDDVAAPMLRAISTIDEETRREEERRPRKTSFIELRSYLEQVLERLDCQIDGAVGQMVGFDPMHHTSAAPLEVGQEAVIRRPGLRDRAGVTRIKALVEPPGTWEAEKENP